MRTFSLICVLWCIPGCFAQPFAHTSREALASNLAATEAGFEPVTNQPGAPVRFMSHGPEYTVQLAPGEIQLTFDRGTKTRVVPEVVRITLAGAKRNSTPQFSDPLPGVTHYYIGNDPSQWRTNVQRFRQIRYGDVYPGIDLLFYCRRQQLEFDFNVAPGGGMSAISLKIAGATVREYDGNLQIVTPGGNVAVLQKPELYQIRAGQRQSVSGGYVIRSQHEIALAAGTYDRQLPLVIDPALIYSTLVENVSGTAAANGGELENSRAIAVDGTGAVYVLGVAADTTFVLKFDATGTALVYKTVLGTSVSHSSAIAVDAAGNAYGVGTTKGTLLPVTTGAFSTAFACGISVGDCTAPFAFKLDPQGKLVFCTYLVNATAIDSAGPLPASIAVDATGALYIAGGLDDPSSVTFVTPATMPGLTTTVGAFQPVKKSNSNLFAMKLHPDGSSVDYATYIGGSGIDNFGGMAIDSTGVAYIAGGTASTDFPTTPGAFQTQNMGDSAVFLKLKNDGSGLLYSTFLGAGGTHSRALSIAVDTSNAAYLTGETDGPGFPTTPGAFLPNVSGPAPGRVGTGNTFNDTFASKFDATGNLTFSTYVGEGAFLPKFRGEFNAFYGLKSVAVDSSGVYMIGISNNAKYPTLHSFAPLFEESLFLTKLDPTGSALVYSTFFDSDQTPTLLGASGLAVDSSQNAYLTGFAFPQAPGLSGAPTTDSAFQTAPQLFGTFPGFPSQMFFVAKIASALGAPVPVPIPRVFNLDVHMANQRTVPVPVQLSNFGDADLTLGSITISGPNAADFTQTNNCGAVVPAGGECVISVDFSYQENSLTNPRTATLTIGFGGGLPSQTVSLIAPGGTPQLQVFLNLGAVTTYDFGPVALGSQATVTLGLFNVGSAPSSLVQISANGDFTTPVVSRSVLLATGAPQPSPVFIPFFQVPVTFKPTVGGARTGQLIVQDEAFNSPHIVQLSGNAVGDFSLQTGASPASVTVTAGGTATYTLVLANAPGFSGSGSFSCTGLPTGTRCSATPATFSFSGVASTQNISIAVSTTGPTASARPSNNLW
ncbi:MAG TPA: hypothetical protein VGJ30_05585, partial [Candidatus Angelobacter sp.]